MGKTLLHILLPLAVVFGQSIRSNVYSQSDTILTLINIFQYDKALIAIEKSIEATPSPKSLTDLYMQKGNVLRRMYHYDQSAESYLNALNLSPENNPVIMEVANSYKLLSDYKQALNYFTKALEKDSSNLFLRLERGNCYFLDGQYEQAVAVFTDLYQKDTLNTYAIQRIAYSYNQLKQKDRAIFFYQKAIDINPLDATSVLSLVNLFMADKNYQKAIGQTENYRSLNPANKSVNSMNAYLYLLNKQYELAINRFRNCIIQNDTTNFVCKNLGIAYIFSDSFETAKPYLEKAYTLNMDDVNALHYLAISCYKSVYKELGIFYMERVLDLYAPTIKDLGIAYMNLAEACRSWSACPPEKKIATALKAYEYNQENPDLALQIGSEYDRNNNYEKAIEYYELYLQASSKKDPQKSVNAPSYLLYQKRITELKNKIKTR